MFSRDYAFRGSPGFGHDASRDPMTKQGPSRQEIMRVLWLTSVLPTPFGPGTRLYSSITTADPTWEIDLVINGKAPPELSDVFGRVQSACRTLTFVPRRLSSRRQLQLRALVSRRSAQYWLFHSQDMQDQIDRSLQKRAYDVVILDNPFMGYYRLPADLPKVLIEHNVESEILRRSGQNERSLLRRAYNQLEYRRYLSDEQRICRSADLIVAMSDRDRSVLESWGGLPPCEVLPTGVDTTYFTQLEDDSRPEQRQSIVFTGTMNYSPNIEGMLYFVDAIWPLIVARVPDATFTIVGSSPPAEIVRLGDRPNITVTGFVDDVRPYVARSQVVVVPLRIGSGIRMKINEALAMGRSVVSTSIGCEGLELQDGRDLLVADEPADFAAAVMQLLNDPARRASLGRAGRRAVEDVYDARVIGKRQEAAIQRLLEQKETVMVGAGSSTWS